MRQFAIRPRRGGVLPARAGSTRAQVEVSETCAPSAITAELPATADELRTRKGATPAPLVPVGFLFHKSTSPAVRCCAQSALRRQCRVPLSLVYPAGCRTQIGLPHPHVSQDRSARPSAAWIACARLVSVTLGRLTYRLLAAGARCVVTSPGRARARPGQRENLSRCATAPSLSIA